MRWVKKKQYDTWFVGFEVIDSIAGQFVSQIYNFLVFFSLTLHNQMKKKFWIHIQSLFLHLFLKGK